MKVTVVGCGYVGLVTGVGLASLGHDVVGVEVDGERRERIAAGSPPFHEPGLADLLGRVLNSGRFRVSATLSDARDSDVVLLAVQTPPRPDGASDLRFLITAAEALVEQFANDARRRVVATRSTVVPGTTDSVVAPILRAQMEIAVASNPEFLREGSAVEDFLRPDRVVVGCHDVWALEVMAELYSPLNGPFIGTTPTTAELAKYTSKAFLATLISFSNEIARICESLPGVDVEDVLGILHQDRRLRPQVNGQVATPGILAYLKSGCGYGGSCLPKDLSSFIAQRHAAGERAPLLEAVRSINDTQPERIVAMASRALDGLAGRTVAVLGAAFKAGTDDLRDSPGLKTVEALLTQGASVVIFDPLVAPELLSHLTGRGVRVAASLADAVRRADACLVTTNDPAFLELETLTASASVPPVVVDGRRILAPERFAHSIYHAIGRGEALQDDVSARGIADT